MSTGLKPYSSYKDSGVEWLGRIPAHWASKKLKYVASLRSGDAITSEDIRESGDYPVFGGNGIRGYSSRFNHRGNYVLIGRQGALCGNINYATGEFWASEHAIVAHLHGADDFTWLGELLRSLNLNQYSQSAAQPGLAANVVSTLQIPVPPICEQKQIAALLRRETEKIDALVKKKERLIELLQEKRTALISHAVTQGLNPNSLKKDSGISWLGETPAHWQIRRIKRTCLLVRDGTHLPPPRVPVGIPLLSVRNIIDGQLLNLPDDSLISETDFSELQRSFQVRENDVVLAIVGATLGKVAIIPKLPPFQIQRSLALLRPHPESLNFKFLFYSLKSTGFQSCLWRNVGFSAQPGIYLGALADFSVAVPPLPEQQTIIEHLNQETAKLDALMAKVQTAIERLQEYLTALISAAVTGQIDVRNQKSDSFVEESI